METTLKIIVHRENVVPTDQAARVAWLERHGVPAELSEVSATAGATDWLGAGGEFRANGSLIVTSEIFAALSDAAARIGRESGSVPGELPAAIVREALASRAAKIAAESAMLDRERREAESRQMARERADARAAEEQAARDAEAARWIAAHGSDRLRRGVAEGLAMNGVYHEERLAHDRPGWTRLDSICGQLGDRANATAAELDALDQARAAGITDARLAWLRGGGHVDGCGCPRDDEDLPRVAQHAILSCEHLGFDLVREIEVAT